MIKNDVTRRETLLEFSISVDVNSINPNFSMLSSTFHVHAVLKLAPIARNAGGAHYLQLYRKNKHGDLHFSSLF